MRDGHCVLAGGAAGVESSYYGGRGFSRFLRQHIANAQSADYVGGNFVKEARAIRAPVP